MSSYSRVWHTISDLLYTIYVTVLKVATTFFTFTAAGVVPYGGPKKSPRTSSIVPIIFSFLSFEISEEFLKNQKIIISLDTFSNHDLIYLVHLG